MDQTPADDGRSMRARMEAGDLYIADDPELAELSLRALDLADAYNATTARQGPLRRQLLEELLGSVGEDTEIRPPFHVDYGHNITIGARSFANFGLVALDVARITIGDDVQIGPHVQLLTPTHPVEPEARRAKWEAAEPITIGDNVWPVAERSSARASPSVPTRWWAPGPSSPRTSRPASSRSATPRA